MLTLLYSLLIFLAFKITTASVIHNGSTCYVYPNTLTRPTTTLDDSPSILRAFDLCGRNGNVILTAHTFHIGQVMNTTKLLNCNVHVYGELVWSSDTAYWLSHSLGVDFQNQSTAWFFGGTNVSLRGHGRGRLNGQGTRHVS